MGEVSGEVALPPQPVETKEAKSNFGLSVNGSQLIALANLDYLEEYGFVRQTKRGIVDKLKALKRLPAHQRLTSIKSLVLEGKNQEAKSLLQQKLTLANPVHKSGDSIEQTIDVLSRNVSLYDALKDKYGDYVDHSFREFIHSLPGKNLKHLFKKSTRIFLTQLGSIGSVDLELSKLNLYSTAIGPFWGLVSLPLDQQRPLVIAEDEVWGKDGKETALAKLEIFEKLASRYPKVFTHRASIHKLPTILQTGHFGISHLYGNEQRKELFVEELTFKDVPQYAETIGQLKSVNEIVIPWNKINPNRDKTVMSTLTPLGYNYPLHELEYIDLEDTSPIAIFSDQLPQEHKVQSRIVDGAIDIKEKCLIGIWVTPQYRQHLLHWVSTWSEEKRQEVFGERKPEDVLIASAKDLPPLEK